MLTDFIDHLHRCPSLIVGLLILLICWLFLLLMWRWFELAGLYLYTATAVIIANLQVLKVAQYALFETPIAMGTVVFSTLFLSGQLITEFYGPIKAKKCILLSVAAQALFTAQMMLTLGMPPVDLSLGGSVNMHEHLMAVFMPTPALFVAGMAALVVGQLYDITIYQWARKFFNGRLLWLRSALGFSVGALLDSIVFNLLAWRVLAAEPLPWDVLFWTYLIGTYGIRLFMGALNIPVLYGLKLLHKNKSILY